MVCKQQEMSPLSHDGFPCFPASPELTLPSIWQPHFLTHIHWGKRSKIRGSQGCWKSMSRAGRAPHPALQCQVSDITRLRNFYVFLLDWWIFILWWSLMLLKIWWSYTPPHKKYTVYVETTEKAMAPHSSALAWKILWTEEPGRLQSMGSLRVGHNWATSLSLFTFMHWRRKWQPTPVFLPGESQGQGSLVGCCLWGRTESDTTEAT